MIKKIITLSFLIFFLYNQLTFGQVKAKRLDSLFISLFNAGKFNGNVLIAENGKAIYQKSFGLANEETKENLNSNSIFELQSISKQFTAMAIVLLKEQGKLNYSDDINKYFPDLNFYKNVTIKNLLNHTNGLPDFYNEPLINYFDKAKIATNKDVVELLIREHPAIVFEPNTAYQYNQTGYALLSLIIEKISHKAYADFLASNIFKPLGMKNTFVYNRRQTPLKINNYAYGYIADSLNRYVLPDLVAGSKSVVYLDGIIGGRGINSTTSDLLLWDRALKSNTLISKAALNEIYSPAILNDTKKSEYGFGWKLEYSQVYGEIVRHSGSNIGHANWIERHLNNDKTIIILQNHAWDNVIIPYEQVRQILYKADTDNVHN
jgi:CubicO group peptidase (beta-lactamase class C family)